MARTLKNIVSDWTDTLNVVEARKKIFVKVRDIEYVILPGQFDIRTKVEQVLEDRKGFCLSKHYLLGELLIELGYDIKYCTYPFNWYESGIPLPQEVNTLALRLPATYHTACKVRVGDSWVLVDATWDKPLAKAGFPVNIWDGQKNTSLAVKTIEEFESPDMRTHQDFYRKKMKKYTLKEKLILARFTKIFNAWIAEIRD